MSENEWKLFVERWKWIWQSFLFFSFLQWWKQTRNEISFVLFFILQILQIVINSRKTKPIVILFGLWFEKSWFWSNWSKWSKSQPHLQRMFWICFVLFLLFDLRIVEKEKCGKRFEICLFATIGEVRERKKEKCDFSHLSNWMKLPRDWIGWMVEIGCNQTTQTTISTKPELDFLLLLSASERNAVFFSFYPIFSAFFEWLFREQEHLNVRMEMEWKSTCCLQIGSAEKWTSSIMNVVFSEIWNV